MTEVSKAIEVAFKQLLSEKHLYQSVTLDLSSACKSYAEIRRSTEKVGPIIRTSNSDVMKRVAMTDIMIEAQVREYASDSWQAHCKEPHRVMTFTPTPSKIYFSLPTINTFCSHCEERWPFDLSALGSFVHTDEGASQQQLFLLSYQCQQCKGLPVRFMVRRSGLKLTLAGRDPIEVLPVPKVIPVEVKKYYSNSLIAYHAGQTLAALFLLRVTVEQFWRTTAAVQESTKNIARPTGDEQGEAYQSRLPQDFRDRFPSLKAVYSKLSEALHSAKEDAALYEQCRKDVEEHFDARRLFKLG